MWKSTVLALVTVSLAGACLYKNTRECPDYVVTEKHPDYEIRSYGSITWASTSEHGSSERVSTYTSFMRLFQYISGNNDKNQKMEMTVPVRMQSVDTDNGTLFTMAFMVPSEFAANAPVPGDSKVKIVKDEPTLYAVRSFPGYVWRLNRWVEEAQKLANSVNKDETVHTSSYYKVGYDAPFELFNRRNEIWMVKRSEEPTSTMSNQV